MAVPLVSLLGFFTVFGIIAPIIQAVLFAFVDMTIILATTTKGKHAANQDQRYLQGASSAHRWLHQI
jgi:Flp pilus assembly protein TadG